MFASLALFAITLALSQADAAVSTVRVATYNIWELTAEKIDTVDSNGAGANAQLRGAAEIIQRIRPDVLLLNEIDYSAERNLAELFRDRYLRVTQNGQKPVEFAYVYYEPVNTGVPTDFDLDNDGKTGGPGDAQGYGRYPGQYGMAVLSRFPLDTGAARTFQKLLWKDMPGNLLPDGSASKPAWYDEKESPQLRLSSKSHWDVPVGIGKLTVHLLCAHPTPPVFDGDEDRNGRRNHDEIRLWVDYLSAGERASYLVDDAGRRGPLAADAAFIILGDLNADPTRDSAAYGPPGIRLLLDHPRVFDPAPASRGALEAKSPGPPNHLERRTNEFGRLDYALCSRNLRVSGSGVFWPAADEPGRELMRDRALASDHRLVWVDIDLTERGDD